MRPDIRKPTERERSEASSWPIWTKDVSEFPWRYDQPERCLIVDGSVTVTNESGEKFDFAAGDWVEFPQGMTCTWTIHEPVKKHYQFG